MYTMQLLNYPGTVHNGHCLWDRNVIKTKIKEIIRNRVNNKNIFYSKILVTRIQNDYKQLFF